MHLNLLLHAELKRSPGQTISTGLFILDARAAVRSAGRCAHSQPGGSRLSRARSHLGGFCARLMLHPFCSRGCSFCSRCLCKVGSLAAAKWPILLHLPAETDSAPGTMELLGWTRQIFIPLVFSPSVGEFTSRQDLWTLMVGSVALFRAGYNQGGRVYK